MCKRVLLNPKAGSVAMNSTGMFTRLITCANPNSTKARLCR
ncbi:MAG: hypothetical protein VB127_10050 [Sphaerochaeta sp.]|nr:hypothetical protein [Sphaerochaeta sp.]